MALNTTLGVASEAAGAAAEAMLLPSLVLAFFVAELTPSYTTIGLVPAIAVAFWTMARIPATLLTSARRRKQPWAFGAAVARAGAILILAIVALRTDPASLAVSARPLLGTLFLCLIVYALASGFGSVPHLALLRGAMGNESWDSFLTRRALWSALLSLLGALVATRLLGANAAPFPNSYGRLFLAAAVILIAVAVFTVAMREPAGGALFAEPAVAPRAWRQPLSDRRFRRLLLFRGLLAATAAIDPFLFLYAVTRLGAPLTAIGSYALLAVLGWVVTTPLWFWLDRRSGPRGVLQGAAVVRLIAPALALALPQLAATDPLRDRIGDATLLTGVYGLAFFALGAALAALSRGAYSYLAAVSTRQHLRPAIALSNVVLAVIAFAPVAGGAVIERFGYEALFGVAAALGLVAVFVGGLLAETPSGAWEGNQRVTPSAALRGLSTGRT
jgi:hypothetical protein